MNPWARSITILTSTSTMHSRASFKLSKHKMKSIKTLFKILKISKNHQERFISFLINIIKVFIRWLWLKILKIIWLLRKIKIHKFITITLLKRLISLLKLLLGIKNMPRISISIILTSLFLHLMKNCLPKKTYLNSILFQW